MENIIKLEKILKSGKGLIWTGAVLAVLGIVCLVALQGMIGEGFNFFAFVMLEIFGIYMLIAGAIRASNKKKTINKLEEKGLIDDAVADYEAETTVKLNKKGTIAFGERYLFTLNSAKIYPYTDIPWAYITVNKQNGIPVSQMLTVCTIDGKSHTVVNEKVTQKGTEKLKRYISVIMSRNPACMGGYTLDNARAYGAMLKEYKAAAKKMK